MGILLKPLVEEKVKHRLKQNYLNLNSLKINLVKTEFMKLTLEKMEVGKVLLEEETMM
jgi:hypothetical protein